MYLSTSGTFYYIYKITFADQKKKKKEEVAWWKGMQEMKGAKSEGGK